MTSLRAAVPLVTLAMLGQGCVAHVKLRSSSATYVTLEQATAHFDRQPPEVAAVLQPEMFSRGFLLTQEVEGAPGTKIYLFKGARKTPRAAAAAEQRPPPHYELGSWFAAKVTLGAQGAGSEVTMFGKPTVNGQEVCSDADSLLTEARYWCQDTEVQVDYPHMELVEGREEADTVRGALASLQAKLPPKEPAGPTAAPTPMSTETPIAAPSAAPAPPQPPPPPQEPPRAAPVP